jgi:hypothetical protein
MDNTNSLGKIGFLPLQDSFGDAVLLLSWVSSRLHPIPCFPLKTPSLRYTLDRGCGSLPEATFFSWGVLCPLILSTVLIFTTAVYHYRVYLYSSSLQVPFSRQQPDDYQFICYLFRCTDWLILDVLRFVGVHRVIAARNTITADYHSGLGVSAIHWIFILLARDPSRDVRLLEQIDSASLDER